MNYIAFLIALILSFYAFAIGQTFLGTIGILISFAYVLSDSLQGLSSSRKEYSSGSSMTTPASVGGDERVAQNVGRGVNSIGSFFGFIVKSIFFPDEKKPEEKKDDKGSRQPGQPRKVTQVIEY